MSNAPTTSAVANTRRTRWLAAVLAVALAAISLAVRLPRLDAFITPDELKWVCRSINFYRGLESGNLAQTRQTGHPGVVTMWLGVPFMGVDLDQPWLDNCQNPSISDVIEQQGVARSHELGAYLAQARRGVVWFTSLCLGLAVLLLVRLFGPRVAGLAGALMAIDPFLLAHSRFLHLDAVTTNLLLLSLLLLLIARRGKRWTWWALSGAAGALAMLNKSPAMVVAPFVGLVLAADWLLGHRPLPEQLGRLAQWAGAALLVYFACWPAMWVQPLQTLELVLGTAFFYASNPHTNSNYFWGLPRPDPGMAFYPVALAFRLTPLSSLGLMFSAPWLALKRERRNELWVVAGFVLVYGLFMTVGQKKFDRYLLPALPFVQILAAVGLWGAVDWLAGRLRKQRQAHARLALSLVLALAVGWTGIGVLSHAPYYLTYYNPLLGGLPAATDKLLVGWGEGLDQAAARLDALQPDSLALASARALPEFAPYYDGAAVHESNYDPATVRYVVMYLNEIQRRLEPAMLERYYDVATPIEVVQLGGVDYAWVYENRTADPVIALLREQGQPGSDAILLSRPALFQAQYDGPLPVFAIPPEANQSDVIALLEELRASYRRVWFVDYWAKNPNPLLDWVGLQLRTHAYPGTSAAFTDIAVSLWRLDQEVSFASAGPVMPTDLLFGDELALESYQFAPDAARWGSGGGIVLNWQVMADVAQYYALHLHLYDDAGHRWGLGDVWMVDQSLRPTVEWRAGETLSQYVPLELLPGVMPGRYRVLLGVRDRVGKEHPLPHRANGEALGEEVDLGWIEVRSSPWDAADLLAPANPAMVALGDGLTLLGWGELPAAVYMGDQMEIPLYWRAEEAPRQDAQVLLQLIDSAGRVAARSIQPVGSREYGASRWRAGEALWKYYALQAPVDALSAATRLQVQLLDPAGEPLGAPVDLGPLPLWGLQEGEASVAHPQSATLGESIALLGYDLAPQAAPGQAVNLTLTWRATDEIAPSYTVFTHLLDADGIVRGQLDSAPLGGRHPTNAWRAGEYVVDHYAIPVDADAPPGDYQVEIGMYDAAAEFQRVPLYVDGVRQIDDRLLLQISVRIVASAN